MALDGAQMALSFAARAQYGRDNFFVSSANSAALALIEAWPRWPDKVLLLIGPSGSGKTHLAHIFAAHALAKLVSPGDLAAIQPQDIARLPTLVLEDIDKAMSPELEAPLFHLLNLMREAGQGLLLTAASAPDLWGIATQDLLSRLRLAPSVQLQAPDDALFRAALRKMMNERQLVVDDTTFDYIALRLDRSLDSAQLVLEKMDHLAMQHQRAITRSLAAAFLNQHQNQPDLFGEDPEHHPHDHSLEKKP
ncbi:MAG: hypothetical protein KGQ46_07430 [Hyphomicrobiales bacterium]|nr:hypothetical protein [Hyphomicrobiales bacterium]MDE2114037.1 hypothetical protein [Hyphomicrobiales bacterium]